MRIVLFIVTTLLVGSQAAIAAAPADAAARQRAEAAGGECTVDASGGLTGISIAEGAAVTAEDVAAFGQASALRKLQILNCRQFDDAMLEKLTGLASLESLAITNSGLGDAGVAAIAASFPNLVELDLSSNVSLTGAAMKSIATLGKLQRLALVQTRFNDLQTRRLAKLKELQTVDLRGNMEAGDMTLGVLGGLPHLRSLKHRSPAVTDEGMAELAASATLESLLIQDFAITDAAGPHLARLVGLKSLEVFRCPGFGSDGVLALAALQRLERLTLRDLPNVGDAGLVHIATARNLETLDIWSLPKMTDASAAVIAGLPALKELSIRETGVTEKTLQTLAALPRLESLTFLNGSVSPDLAAKVRGSKAWKKLDLGK